MIITLRESKSETRLILEQFYSIVIGYFINYRCFEIRASFESNITALRIPRSPGVALSIVYIILHNSTEQYIYICIHIYMHKFLYTRYQYGSRILLRSDKSTTSI